VNTELANKACAHLLTAPTDATNTATKACTHLLITSTNATDPATKANLFVYSTTAKSCYTFTVFIRIIVNTNVAHWKSVRKALRESLTGLIDYRQETWPFKYRKLLLAYLSWCHVRMASCAQPHAAVHSIL
jgi:hypothetical protein